MFEDKKFWGVILTLLVCGLVMGYILNNVQPKARTIRSGPVDVVRASITVQTANKGTFRSGPLRDGTAVMSSRDWAYWVHDGTVYAVNGLAKSGSPATPWAPNWCSYFQVKAATR